MYAVLIFILPLAVILILGGIAMYNKWTRKVTRKVVCAVLDEPPVNTGIIRPAKRSNRWKSNKRKAA